MNIPHFNYAKDLLESFVQQFDLVIPENDKIIYTLNFLEIKFTSRY